MASAYEFDMPLPAEFARSRSAAEPSTPRDAATVVLLRDGASVVEVFLQRRVTGMSFAGGMTVFPGGGVDSRDADTSVAWLGPTPDEWAQWFGCTASLARALVCAAVRETFEESGVLLAGTESAVVADTTRYARERDALAGRELSLAGFLATAGLTLRADLLRPWANWITPEQEPRRYDTRFFVAALPHGQHADGATTEAAGSDWQSPAAALADAREGASMLLPPTWATLREVGEYATVADVLAERRAISPIRPDLVAEGDSVRVEVRGRGDGGQVSHPSYEQPRQVSRAASVVLENNPSAMTLEGTNSWVLAAPGAHGSVVVDPGYAEEAHLGVLERLGQVELIVLTHHHPDHAQGAPELAGRTGAPVRAFDETLCRAAEPLADGETFAAAGLEFHVLHTPGHTADSVSLRVDHEDTTHVLTGDTVLGYGTTVLSDLGDYLYALRVLRELPKGALGLPGHGPELTDLPATVRSYAEHREQRLDQVREALRTLGASPAEANPRAVVEIVYADVDRSLWGPAEASVQAQLDYLAAP